MLVGDSHGWGYVWDITAMTRERPGGFGDRPIRTWRVHGYGAWAGRAGDTDPSAFRVGVGGSAAGQAKDTRPVRDTRCDAVPERLCAIVSRV